MTSNPVEFGALIGLFVALFLVALFSRRRESLMSALPSLKNIDGLLYRTVGVAFPLLSLLLITGAVWLMSPGADTGDGTRRKSERS